jgi:hypothetical protein
MDRNPYLKDPFADTPRTLLCFALTAVCACLRPHRNRVECSNHAADRVDWEMTPFDFLVRRWTRPRYRSVASYARASLTRCLTVISPP